MKYPMWYIRFMKARNLLGDACCEMSEAMNEDGGARFIALHSKMSTVMKEVEEQRVKNFERGRKEGWLK